MLIRGMAYDVNEIINEVGLPCFVKPNAEGSSFGVTKVKEAAQLEDALKKAFALCQEVLIETFIDGTELTCGVVKAGDMDIAMPIAEVIPKNEFFDFEAKYDPTKSDEIIPARISPELTNRIKTLSSMIYDILRCEGIIRVYFYDQGLNPRCFRDFVNLEVWSSADWDAEHPAGTSLNDLARFSSNTPWPYIQSGYTQKYHEQLNGEYYPVDKLISELTPDDMTLLPRGGFYFRFVTRPAQPGKHTLFVRLTADDGKVFEASCDVEFQ